MQFTGEKMEEELLKRNTDCVYFLASPLTCKKHKAAEDKAWCNGGSETGVECEYRHSDIARLNPRDCWYWLAGSCLNPTCGFRHPPLQSFSGMSYESTTTYHQPVVQVNKTNVPCFFYNNGFCNKGDKCVFLHGPDDGVPTLQSSKIASRVPDGLAVEKKKCLGSEKGSAQVETHPSSFETSLKISANAKVMTEVNLQPATDNLTDGNTSPGISGSQSEEAVAVKLISSLPAEGFTEGGSHLATAWSSDDEMEDNIERGECLESSPGFDVLVNDRSGELGYEVDHEYSLQNDMDGRTLDEQYMGDDSEDNSEYHPVHLDTGIVLDDECTSYLLRKINGHARQRVKDCILPWKRKNMPTKWAFSAKGNMDLRNHLKGRQTVDRYTLNHYHRRHDSSYFNTPSTNRPHCHSTRKRHQRLASKVESKASGSQSERGSFLNGINHESTLRHSHMSSRRQHFKRIHSKKLPFLSQVSRMGVSKKRESTDKSKLFSAPKTLSQIKEEKRRAKGDWNLGPQLSGTNVEDEFQGPKSLAEILQSKRR
nr:zinc finger CCCH domain-containing protein 34-like [Ipomoea batatas]